MPYRHPIQKRKQQILYCSSKQPQATSTQKQNAQASPLTQLQENQKQKILYTNLLPPRYWARADSRSLLAGGLHFEMRVPASMLESKPATAACAQGSIIRILPTTPWINEARRARLEASLLSTHQQRRCLPTYIPTCTVQYSTSQVWHTYIHHHHHHITTSSTLVRNSDDDDGDDDGGDSEDDDQDARCKRWAVSTTEREVLGTPSFWSFYR